LKFMIWIEPKIGRYDTTTTTTTTTTSVIYNLKYSKKLFKKLKKKSNVALSQLSPSYKKTEQKNIEEYKFQTVYFCSETCIKNTTMCLMGHR